MYVLKQTKKVNTVKYFFAHFLRYFKILRLRQKYMEHWLGNNELT